MYAVGSLGWPGNARCSQSAGLPFTPMSAQVCLQVPAGQSRSTLTVASGSARAALAFWAHQAGCRGRDGPGAPCGAAVPTPKRLRTARSRALPGYSGAGRLAVPPAQPTRGGCHGSDARALVCLDNC